MPSTAEHPRIRLMGLEINAITEPEAIATILRALAEGRGGAVVTPNLDHVRNVSKRPELAGLFRRADLVVADGMPLVWASRLQGTPLPARVPGSDLVWSLTAEAALRDKSVFLLGGAPGACDAAEERLRTLYPGAKFAGTWCPPLGFEYDAREIDLVRRRLRDANPDIVYVALGFPKQERLIAYLRSEFPSTWFLGIGFSLSFVAGQAKRAPAWMIRLGLEWVHRMVQDPRRLVKRYLVQDMPFASRLFASALWARLTRRHDVQLPDPTERRAALDERVVFSHGSIERVRAQLLEELMGPD
jgi:N-acetylglucosaminyldiphosphoundecaprenol N-acetyl-beta-D-mannosaminyltransferase